MLRSRQGRALGQGKPAQSSWRCPFFAQLFQLNRRNPRLRPRGARRQFYLGDSHASIPRPEKELKGFAKVNLQPDESKQLSAMLDQRAFSFYDVGKARLECRTRLNFQFL